jgi:hypothetical protein
MLSDANATDTQTSYSDEELRKAIDRLNKNKMKHAEYQKKRGELMKTDPEAAQKIIEQRKVYNKSEKAVERRKAYYAANKDKIKNHHKTYLDKQRALIEQAREKGLLPPKGHRGDWNPQQQQSA